MPTEIEKLAKKINNGRQFRSMVLECRAKEKEEDEESYIVEGYATTYNEPYTLWEGDEYRYDEQVDAHAFDKTDMSDVIMQYDHAGRVFARLSNKTLEIKSDEHGLFIRANLGGTEEGRKLYEEIKGGYTRKMSFGFTVRGDRLENSKDENNKRIYLRTITDIERLYDVSAVSLPANDGTEISARAYCDGVIAKLEAERLQKAEEERKMKVEQEERTRKLALLALKK